MLKIDCDKKTAALKEAIRGSICSETTWLQKVDHNDSECASDDPSGHSQRKYMGCGAKEQYWARLLGTVSMLLLLAPLSWAALSCCSLCAHRCWYPCRIFSWPVSRWPIALENVFAVACSRDLGRTVARPFAPCGTAR